MEGYVLTLTHGITASREAIRPCRSRHQASSNPYKDPSPSTSAEVAIKSARARRKIQVLPQAEGRLLLAPYFLCYIFSAL